MRAKRSVKKSTALEIRRLTFRSANSLFPLLEGLEVQDLGGGEIRIVNDAAYSKVVSRLKNAGIQVKTVYDRRNDLPYIHRDRFNTPFRRERIQDDPAKWYYLSPNARRWRRVPHDENSLIVRDGWALCHFPAGSHHEFYYLEGRKPILDCVTKGNIAILKGYAGVTGVLPVPIWEDQRFIYAIWPGYVIPKEHQNFLAEALSPLDQQLNTEEMETLWMWRQADRKLIEEVLRAMRLELRPAAISSDWVRTLSAILYRAYGQYLQKWEGLEQFPEIVRCRAWEEIEDDALRQILAKLSEEESKGNVQAHVILEYLVEKLPVAISWQDTSTDRIRVFVLESSEVTWHGQDTSQRYYRLVLPQFECVIGWKSRALPRWGGYARPIAEIGHWRILPYPGRMRTGRNPDITPLADNVADKEKVVRTLVGIPKVEWDLSQSGCIDAFGLDLEASHWKGALDFVRYWYGTGKVARRDPSECDQPGLLLRDITGFEFLLAAPELPPRQRPNVGDWVGFIASTSLIEQTSGPPLPTFALARPEMLNVLNESRMEELCVLAMIRYYFGITQDKLRDFFTNAISPETLERLLNNLNEANEVVRHKNRYYYRYNTATPETLRRYIETYDPVNLPLPLHNLRGILHPLSPVVSNLVDSNGQLFRAPTSAWEIRITSDDVDKWAQEAESSLRNQGYAIVSGRGPRRRIIALEAVKHVINRFDAGVISVGRLDSTFKDSDGHEHPQLDFTLIYPAQLLKKRYR